MIELAPGVLVAPRELRFRVSRSSGPGGQNVNKVATRVELVFDVQESPSLEPDVRRVLLRRLAGRLDARGRIHLTSQAGRTQAENRRRVLERLRRLVSEALAPVKPRKPTRPTRASRERRLKAKKARGEIKRLRTRPPD